MVSVTTYRDAGFLPQAFINFLCLLGWSPKDDREKMARQELIEAFSFEGINHDNAVVNFTEEDPFDPKAVWLNAEYIRALPVEELARQLMPFVRGRFPRRSGQDAAVTPLIQERIKLLRDVRPLADFFFLDELPPYDQRRTDPAEGRRGHGGSVLQNAAARFWRRPNSRTTLWTRRLRAAADELKDQGRTDVPANSRGGVRAQNCAAVV